MKLERSVPYALPAPRALPIAAPAPPERPPSPELERIRRHQGAAGHSARTYLDREEDFSFSPLLLENGTARIAFRGTLIERWSNLKADLNCLRSGRRHKGFMSVWALLQPRVLEWLRTNRPQSLVLTGHSLGGAVALLAAYELVAEWTVEEVTVFGCPRVGTPRFAKSYLGRKSGPGATKTLGEITARYVHATDVISRVPPPLLWYQHVGESVNLNHAGFRLRYPQPYLVRILDTCYACPAQFASPALYGLQRFPPQPGLECMTDTGGAASPDFSVLSMIARALGTLGPTLGIGLVPLWAPCALVLALLVRFVRRDFYLHDSKRYCDVLENRAALVERGPIWWQTTI